MVLMLTIIHFTLKTPVMTVADDIYNFFFFSEKIRLDVSFESSARLDVLSESSARQRIHMKNQVVFSSKDQSKKVKMSSAAIFVWCFKG